MPEIKIPDLGGAGDVEVIDIIVSPGDSVALEDSLITVESDKASMDVPSPYLGTITKVMIRVGDIVNEGDVIAIIDSEAIAAEPVATDKPVTADNKASLENNDQAQA
ncbi:MAG: pyruvate/2-oxoglutarate dehydrogenase complex dihydrolipoamide acyltransferase (E2) component, partial [Arenicella sp.]